MQTDPNTNADAADAAAVVVPPPPAGPGGQPRLSTRRRGCMTCGVIALLVFLAFAWSAWLTLQTYAYEAIERSSCRQIRIVLAQYAAEDGPGEGLYPDGRHLEIQSANDLFRQLFKAGIVTDERLFGCRGSVFQADQKIGAAPDFAQAVGPGECHWMVLKHQGSNSHGKTPVIIENAGNTIWPPRWKLPAAWRALVFGLGLKPRSHAWRDGCVLVGRADGSAEVEKLRPDGTLDWHSKNNLDKDGKSWIDYLTPEQVAKLEYWDVEEKK